MLCIRYILVYNYMARIFDTIWLYSGLTCHTVDNNNHDNDHSVYSILCVSLRVEMCVKKVIWKRICFIRHVSSVHLFIMHMLLIWSLVLFHKCAFTIWFQVDPAPYKSHTLLIYYQYYIFIISSITTTTIIVLGPVLQSVYINRNLVRFLNSAFLWI